MLKIELIVDAKNELGEGPVWDPVDGVLYWIDSKAPSINRYDPRSLSVRTWPVPPTSARWPSGRMAEPSSH